MKQKFSLYSIIAACLFAVILIYPEACLSYALKGLNLWFTKMIPALFPFMVLSGVIIRLNLAAPCVQFLMPFLGRIFRVGPSCVYGMVVGFLCGFPMGAHTAAQLYENKMISQKEASFLLAFCNNIGPVYFLSFVMPLLGITSPGLYLFGMYALPFFYGLILRYTIYSGNICVFGSRPVPNSQEPHLASALDQSIESALLNIARLGGYMIVFNLLFILPTLAFGIFGTSPYKNILTQGFCCLLEITGGISTLGQKAPYFVLCALPFGGLSCIAQTYSMIRGSGLSITEYIMHKMILTAITVFFYLLAANQFFLP